MKHCLRCATDKPTAEFGANKGRHDGLAVYCIPCLRQYNTEYRQRNLERLKRHASDYGMAHRAEITERARIWCENNRERHRQTVRAHVLKNAEHVKARIARWIADNLEHHRAYQADYAGRRRALGFKRIQVAKVSRQQVYLRDKGICGLCGKKVEFTKMDIDHIIPLSKGGSHVEWNMQVSHPSCNRSRQAGRIPAQTRLNI